MLQRRMIELIVIGLWVAIAIVVIFRCRQAAPVPDSLKDAVVADVDAGQKYEITRLIVLRGDTFDLTTKKGNLRLMAKLTVRATDDAKTKVLDIMNHSTNPRVVLREKQSDGHWTVDIFFTNGKEVNMAEWLVSNNLVYK